MTKALPLLFVFMLASYAPKASSEINLNVKIGQVIGSEKVETVKIISAEYNQDIVIMQEGLDNKIVLNLRKFNNISVNGNKINPVQIDMKLVNNTQKLVGKTQTVTTFYKKSAQFNVSSKGLPGQNADLNVSLDFQEI